MTTYSIVKIDKDYIVFVDSIATLKFTSRRKAARIVAHASELLADTLAARAVELAAGALAVIAASIPCDSSEAA